jgi:hypothetical protein
MKVENGSFENVSQFKYLGMTVTNQNLIQKQVKRGLKSDNACHHSVQKLQSFLKDAIFSDMIPCGSCNN